MKYFNKYKYLIIKSNNIGESRVLHELFFDNGFTWNGKKEISHRAVVGYFIIGYYPDRNCIYLVFYNEGNNKGGLSISTATDLIKYYDGKYNGNIYNINDYNLVKNILIYGTDIPNYKPKKIIFRILW